ncbi:glycoside hydrolase family 97 catalytic domain-containing protein [Pontiellaceae bacterium B12219]|nr:glycoside hydrolase family 97 catalytic domain-containing protein [Pontiellaceae bacterium B12219]
MKMSTGIALLVVALWMPLVGMGALEISSLDGQVSVAFDVKDGSLFYSVSKDGKPIMDASKMEIFAGSTMSISEYTIEESDSNWKPVWGQFSSIRDRHNELTLSLEADGVPVTLLCRVFDDGVGFRFVMSEESKGKKIAFVSQYKVVAGGEHYTHGGESGVKGPFALEAQKKYSLPLVTLRDDAAVALLESDLYSCLGFNSMTLRWNAAEKAVDVSSHSISTGVGQVTPWRVILVGDSIGELMVNNVVLNLAAPCKLKDTSWIKPGKGLWDWRVHGYDNGEFVYDINTKSFLRYIDFCAAQGIEYITIDDHWFLSADNGTMVISPEVDIEQTVAYAKEKGVGVILYYDRKKGNFGDETLFSYYAGLGAVGMKYGFMGSKADFTRDSIDAAAEHEMLIFHHDGPVPMSGVERTMPNLITREYCHAQQDSRRAFTPESFLKMAMVSALVGPLDQANGNFGIKSINAGERKKGPKKKNSYISTVVSECARCLVIYTGLITLPDAPEEYLKKADLFEYLKQLPASWDETRVLHAEIGESVSVARRTGDTWFVGSVNNQQKRSLDLVLDFLEPGTRYEATLYQDAPDSHGVKNPEAYEIKTVTVKRGDVIPATMAVGGGHCMWIRPAE